MDTEKFENSRWSGFVQQIEFRHRAAYSLIRYGSVLDVGAGDGLLLSLLRGKSSIEYLEGADISPEAVKKCRERGIPARVITSAGTLPYEPEAFDTVVLLDVLEHVYDPVPVLQEALRVASTQVIVGVPNFSSLPARLQTLFGRVPENNRPNKGHIYWFNNKVLEDVVAQAGGRMEAKKMNTQRIFPPFLANLFPNLFALSFIIKIIKNG